MNIRVLDCQTRKGIKHIISDLYPLDDCGEYYIIDGAICAQFRTVHDEPSGIGTHCAPSSKADVQDALARALNACHENVYFYLPSNPPFDERLTENIFLAIQKNPKEKSALESWAGGLIGIVKLHLNTIRDHCDRNNAYSHLYHYDSQTVDWSRIIRSLKAKSGLILPPEPFPPSKPVADAWRKSV